MRNVFDYAKHSSAYGINVENPTADFGGVIKRSRGVADKMNKGVTFLMKKNKIDVIMGYGTLTGKGKIEVKQPMAANKRLKQNTSSLLPAAAAANCPT